MKLLSFLSVFFMLFSIYAGDEEKPTGTSMSAKERRATARALRTPEEERAYQKRLQMRAQKVKKEERQIKARRTTARALRTPEEERAYQKRLQMRAQKAKAELTKIDDLIIQLKKDNEKKPPASQIKAFWYTSAGNPNFGDDLNPILLRIILDSEDEIKRFSDGPNFIGMGSIVSYAAKGVHVWGSGAIRRDLKPAPDATYHAVRGPLTRDLIVKNGGECPEIYGDPALLYPRFFNPAVKQVPGRVGFIPHYVHIGEVKFDDPNIHFLNIQCRKPEEIEAFVTQLKTCEHVVSSSLHGIIVAHAYGIPAQWVKIPFAKRKLSGDGMKFRDYFMGVGVEPQTPLILGKEIIAKDIIPHVSQVVPSGQLHRKRMDLLLAAFPFKCPPKTS